MDVLLCSLTEHTWIDLSLTSYPSFATWRNSNPVINALIKSYEQESDLSGVYKKVSQACFDAVFPMDSSTLDEFLGTLRNMETIYNSVRDLFIKLGSYNITYLEIARDKKEYLQIDDCDIVMANYHHDFSQNLGLILPPVAILPRWVYDLGHRELQIEYVVTDPVIEYEHDFGAGLVVGFDIDHQDTQVKDTRLHISYDPKVTGTHYHINFTIAVGEATAVIKEAS